MNLCEEAVPLARAYQLQLEGSRASAVEAASSILQDSLARDSASAYRWLDLSQALAQQGRIDQASYCVTRAEQLGGHSADVLLTAGDFYLRYGDRSRGLRDLAQTLSMTRVYDQPVFGLFDARNVAVDEVLAVGMPPGKLPSQAYLRHLIAGGDTNGAEKVWRWMTGRQLTDIPLAIEYCDFLFAKRLFQQSAAEWASAVGAPNSDYRSRQLLFNGDFANEPLPWAVFDWKIAPMDHIAVGSDCTPQPGGCSLKIQFDGSANVDFNNVSQIVVLEPGNYRFSAFVRTDQLTTDQGLVFEIQDGEDAGRLHVESEGVTGTRDWQKIELPFKVLPTTNFVQVRLRRHPSQRFDNRINGTAWIRQASLVREHRPG